MPRLWSAFALATSAAVALGCGGAAARVREQSAAGHMGGIHKIRHVIVIMQENRSFDSYFGTYPGADGIPRTNGRPTVCLPDPLRDRCVRPYHDSANRDWGGPHQLLNAIRDINGDRMNGFLRQARRSVAAHCAPFQKPQICRSATAGQDVMGYHDWREIPNYWAYARRFVLQDHMFEPNDSWTLPAHLFLVSEWSARCSRPGDPTSCVNALENPVDPPAKTRKGERVPDYAWTDLTYCSTSTTSPGATTS